MPARKTAAGRRPVFAPGNRYLIAFLAFLSAFAPVSTDMYLPALPEMAANLGTSNELVTLTISGFLFVFALSMLLWGPLSDRFGRRPVLLAGSAIFVFSSVGIALSPDMETLMAWRCLQALGSGAASAMSMAIIKDLLRGSLMERVVSLMQAGMILAPMLAPVLGGLVLMFTDWRGIFWCLALFGIVAFAGGLALRETRPASGAAAASLAGTFGRIGAVLKKPQFARPLLLFSAMSMPFMSFLAVSSFIYQDYFGLSPQAYSLFFAFNATASLCGPISHIYVFRHFERKRLIAAYLGLMCAAGLLLLFFGSTSPWAFALLFLPVTFCGSAMRPPSTVLLLQSVDGDNGVVASLINCGALLCGSLSMLIASLGIWPGPISAVAVIAALVSGVCFICWLKIGRN